MCRQRVIVILILLLINSIFSWGYEAPRKILSEPSSFATKGLGFSCYALDLPADVLPCNPAFISKERNRRFSLGAYWGNHVSYMDEATDLSEGRADSETIRNLFQNHSDNELQSQIEFGYIQELFGFSVTPFQVNYLTHFRNEVLPEISVYASLEESAKIQFGSFLENDWSYGIQLRYLRRRFVASNFFLTDALVTNGNELLDPREQNLFFIEPGILYAPKDNHLNPEFTIMVANLGYVNEAYSEVPLAPQYHLTTSIAPELHHGRFGLGLDLRLEKNMKDSFTPLTLGSYYEFKIFRLFGSLAKNEQAIGLITVNTWWNLGIIQRNESYEDDSGVVVNLSRTFVFLGAEF